MPESSFEYAALTSRSSWSAKSVTVIRSWVPRRSEMNRARLRILIAIATLLTANALYAQNGDNPAYLNPALPPEERAEDLVRRMIVEEKATQLVNQSRAK